MRYAAYEPDNLWLRGLPRSSSRSGMLLGSARKVHLDVLVLTPKTPPLLNSVRFTWIAVVTRCLNNPDDVFFDIAHLIGGGYDDQVTNNTFRPSSSSGEQPDILPFQLPMVGLGRTFRLAAVGLLMAAAVCVSQNLDKATRKRNGGGGVAYKADRWDSAKLFLGGSLATVSRTHFEAPCREPRACADGAGLCAAN